MDRRTFLIASATAVTAATVSTAVGAETEGPFGATGVPLPLHGEALPLGPLPNARIPDVHIETLDPRFRAGEAVVERVASGFRWAEGPAYFAAGRYLVFSDIPNNRMMRLLEDDNHLSVFRYPSLSSNGNTVDHHGRLYTCEHAGRRVTRTEYDGSITVIADRYNGKKLNSPNDIVVASNGSIWFTDPTYGIKGWFLGFPRDIEQDKHNVFRVDGKTGEIKVVADDFVQPNGIMFSPDETKLYVIDTGISEGPFYPAHIRVFDVDIDTGKLSNGKVFVDNLLPGGVTDGMRCDVEGNVWCAMGWGDPKEDGVRCYDPDGTLLAKIHLPETAANLTFGGQSRNRLYICASSSIYACYVNTQGAAPG